MGVNTKFVCFDKDALPPADVLAHLHAELLPRSPVAKLGRRFMEKFYYRVLPQMGSIYGVLAYVDSEPAGFIVVTDDPAGFMPHVIRRHWFSLGWTLATSLLLAPRRIASAIEGARIMASRPAEERTAHPMSHEHEYGEILSFGVLEPYRQIKFVRATGLRLGSELMDRALDMLGKSGVEVVRAIVDADNMPAQMFYRGLEWKLVGKSGAGWKYPGVEFSMHLNEQAGETSDSPGSPSSD